MAEFPALPLFTDAYLADTAGTLSGEEHGVYLIMLMVAWRDPECRISRDDAIERVKAVCKDMTGQRAHKVVDRLLMRFWREDGPKWFQRRLEDERKFLRRRSEDASKNGRRGNEIRWGQRDNDRNPIPSHPHPHLNKKACTYPQEEVERCSTCGGEYPDAATGRVSGCTCPPDPDWKPKPLPAGLATVRTNGTRSEQPTSAAGEDVVFDLTALLAGFGKPGVTTKPSGKGNGTAVEVQEPRRRVSWRRKADGTFERT